MAEEWPEPAIDFVQAINDTKLVLSHRYAEWMLSGPTLEDDIGGASAAQDEVGHVRQLIRLLEQQGRETEWLEGNRSPEEYCNAASIDDTNDSWVEFIGSVAATDRAVWLMLDSIVHSDFDGLTQKIGEDEFFHLEYHDARLETLANERPDELQSVFETSLPKALAFIGPITYDEDNDPLLEAEFTDRSAIKLREELLSHFSGVFESTSVSLDGVEQDSPSPEVWDETRRRVGDGSISQEVVDSLQGTSNEMFRIQ